MSLKLGRAGIDVDLHSPSRWNPSGDLVDFDVTVAPDASGAQSGEARARVLVQQLAGILNSPDLPVVPVVWDAWPAVDGFYEPLDLDVKMVGPSLANGMWKVSGSLRRVSAFGSPLIESHLLHALRSGSAVTAANSDPLVGVPGGASVYRRGTVGLGSLVSRDCDGGAVLVDVWAGTDAQANAEWQVSPAGFYEGACRISDLTAGPSVPYTILGRQVPGGLDPNEGWALGNGLVTVLPSEAIGGTAGTVTVLSWAGAAYESATALRFRFHAGNPASTFTAVTILRNSPEVTTIRLTGEVALNLLQGGFFTLDLTVRRGDRNLQGVIRTTVSQALETGPSSAPVGTAITGAIRQTSNDADGNRFVVSSALGTLTAVGSSAGLTGTLLDFGFGVEIGGSGSAGIETAQTLANQYAGAVGEFCEVVEP